jgi:hypothetical protein
MSLEFWTVNRSSRAVMTLELSNVLFVGDCVAVVVTTGTLFA